MLGILDLNEDLLVLIASLLLANAARRFADCIKDDAKRAAVQGAPARVDKCQYLCWYKPRALPPFRWMPSGRPTVFVAGGEHFLHFWPRLEDYRARHDGGAPWLKLIVADCAAVRDWHLVALGPICTALELRGCPAVSDVGPLGCVRALKISRCALVGSIEGLGGRGQESVSLDNIPIADAGPVGGVPRVSLARCPLAGLKGFGAPGQTLRLENLPIAGFGDLEGRTPSRVLATNCERVLSAAGLEGCETEVSLDRMQNLRDVSGLCGVPRVEVIDCPEVRELWRGSRGQFVYLCSLPVADVDGLAGVSSLVLSACDRVQDLRTLTDVGKLYVRNCRWLNDTRRVA